MADKIEICKCTFEYDSNFRISPVKFRGFMAHLFSNISEFHHHSDNPYHYPLIQYKRLDNKIAIIGIGNFAEIVANNMADIDHITTENEKIAIRNIQISNETFVQEYGKFDYRFSSPWIALNKENYEKFKSMEKEERKSHLERILVGNILSMYKGLGIRLENRIGVSIHKQFIKKITAHSNPFVGFYPQFTSSTNIPEGLGIGKSVSKGYGVISRHQKT
jgi:hypothetical protein